MKVKFHIFFNVSILTHFTIFLLVLLLSETVGLWFVMTQLNIPVGRETATMWVYQMSVVTTLIGIMVIPYRASIIAAERECLFLRMCQSLRSLSNLWLCSYFHICRLTTL